MLKKKKIFNKEKKINESVVIKEKTNFETTDFNLAVKLQANGFKLLTVASPFGERKVKLYVFKATEGEVKEVLDGK